MGANTEQNRGSYVPVMGHYWLLPLYDLLQGLLGVVLAHQTLIDQADMRPGHGVLEIGCGTGYPGQLEHLGAVIQHLFARHTPEGKSKREITRFLERIIARED